jgi:hypothetical protein
MPSTPAPVAPWPAPEPAPYEPAPYAPPVAEPAPYEPAPYEPAPYAPPVAEPAPYEPAPYAPPVAEPAPYAPPVAEPASYAPPVAEPASYAERVPPVWGAPPSPEDSPADVRDLIAALAARSGELFGVADTAQVLADDLVERAEADAAAVLVPDGNLWRVSGSVGLRPLERRAVLDAGHWVITQIALGGQVLLLQDTALARPKLAGAPLATWRHVLAVPVPQVQALVILARGPAAPPFGEADLARVAGPVAEAAALLATAMQTRRMARLLAPLREDDGIGAP